MLQAKPESIASTINSFAFALSIANAIDRFCFKTYRNTLNLNLHSAVCSLPSHKKFRNRCDGSDGKQTHSHTHSHQSRDTPAFARSISTYRVGISVARFKIGHTPRKLPGQPPATFRFNAYLFAPRPPYARSLPSDFPHAAKTPSSLRRTCIQLHSEHCAVTQVSLYTMPAAISSIFY